jgi:hypothetical protein
MKQRAATQHCTRCGRKWIGPFSSWADRPKLGEVVGMGHRLGWILVLALVGCTGSTLPVLPPGSRPPVAPSARQSAASTGRIRTILKMEVGPSVHPGSFRAMGTLAEATGAPVAGAAIQVTLTPIDEASPSPFDLGTRTTDGKGGFQVTFHLPRAGRFLVDAWYAGDDRHRPAHDQGPVSTT